MALQAELLLAYTRGIRNVLCLTGNAVPVDDHKEAKGVFGFDSSQLLATIRLMESGQDVGGNNLDGTVEFCAVRWFLRRLTGTLPREHPPDLDYSLPLRNPASALREPGEFNRRSWYYQIAGATLDCPFASSHVDKFSSRMYSYGGIVCQ